MGKALSARQVLEISRRTITLKGGWGECVGTMDRHGVVFVWGNSGNGKTSAVVSLCRQLSEYGRVLYLSLEEGYSYSLQTTLRRYSMADCGASFQVLESCTVEELDAKLSARRSPEFVVIDSFQYMNISYKYYLTFKERHRGKLLIFISHADGKQPSGRAAKAVRYDAGLKIWVEGYKAFSKGRFIGPVGNTAIWEKGADDYWIGKQLDRNI